MRWGKHQQIGNLMGQKQGQQPPQIASTGTMSRLPKKLRFLNALCLSHVLDMEM